MEKFLTIRWNPVVGDKILTDQTYETQVPIHELQASNSREEAIGVLNKYTLRDLDKHTCTLIPVRDMVKAFEISRKKGTNG